MVGLQGQLAGSRNVYGGWTARFSCRIGFCCEAYLEYDSERAGGFEPLAKVPADKYVVLGLLTSKSGELEDRQVILDRIQEAAQYHDLDKLCLSTQCGFSSTEEDNILTEEQQWAKIALVKSIAEEVWDA